MKRKILYLAFFVTFSMCCKEEVITVDNIFDSLETDKINILADGTTTVLVTAVLNKNGDENLRTINFEADRGIFVETGKNQISKKAEVNTEEQVEAKVVLVAPTTTGPLEIRAQVELDNLKDRYIQKAIIDVSESMASDIQLTTSSFSVAVNFGSDIDITGVIKNSDGNQVSDGVEVRIYDTDVFNNPLSGSFRQKNLVTSGDSKISAIYSPGTISADQFVYVKAEVLDENKQGIGIRDSVRIYVRNN